ncbi:MAG: ectoine hydroxylase-related dioxygenase (phytanoyl-CoA dioxygenase family) [Candidatus Latescibacterota bacterium]|jgi:ectoine hydroxylase-related dioxygenase (phytanoyl-CoA dioxygenase family)
MDRDAMTNEENYTFDIAGYLHVPGVLAKAEVGRLNAAINSAGKLEGMLRWDAEQRDPFRDLLIQPQLVWYLNQIVGPGFRLDCEPEILCNETCDTSAPLVGGNEPRDPGLAYYHQNNRRFCERVRVVWVLEDVNAGEGGFMMVPGSHKSNVATPEDILTGADDKDFLWQPVLKAGDLLIVGLSVLQGIRPWLGEGTQRLLSYEYVGRGVMGSAGVGPDAEKYPQPEWMPELTPEQQASLYKPGYRDTTPPPTLVTDGETVTVDASRKIFHPSILIKDPNSMIDETEFYFWDLNGYLVLRGVMDEAWLAEANAVVDAFEDQIVVGEVTSGKSKSLVGTGRPELKGLLQLPAPHCDPFRRMIAHSVIEHRLNWMGASGGRTGSPSVFASVKGTSGHAQHGNGEPINPGRQYVYQNGRSYCQAVTVTWQLRDVSPGDGGFACVPGSHKANYPPPPGVQTCDDDMGLVKHIGMKAGDVLFFMDGATSHGTFPWQGDLSRRGVLVKYSSRNFNRSGGELAHPEKRWGNLVDGMNDAQLAVMRGPDRDVFGRNVPRLDVQNGEISVSYERGGGLYSKDTPTGPVAKS